MDVKMWINVVLFGIAIAGATASYFKTTSAIDDKVTKGIAENKKNMEDAIRDLRMEVRQTYATKESSEFQKETLLRIEGDIKEIKGTLGRERR